MKSLSVWKPAWIKMSHWEPACGCHIDFFRDGGRSYSSSSSEPVRIWVDAVLPNGALFLRISGAVQTELKMQIATDDAVVIREQNFRTDINGLYSVFLDNDWPRHIRVVVQSAENSLYIKPLEIALAPLVEDGADSAVGVTPIYAGLATIPTRHRTLESVVNSLLAQVDRLFVVLNGFVSVPDFLSRERITVIRSQDIGDLRDNSKLFGLYCFMGDAHYVTCDDDIVYPDDYVKTLVDAIEKYGRKCVVGVHGAIYGAGSRHFRDRLLLHFEEALEEDLPVNVLGTGTVAFHTSTYRPDYLRFRATGMVDLMVAEQLSTSGVPCLSISRRPDFIRAAAHGKEMMTLYNETRVAESPHDILVRTHEWSLSTAKVLSDQVDGALGDQALLLVAYERALASGVPPSDLALPGYESSKCLAQRLGIAAIEVSAVIGRLASAAAVINLQISAGCTPHEDHGFSDAHAAAKKVVEQFLDSIVRVDVHGVVDDNLDALTFADRQWVDVLSRFGRADLLCVHAALCFLLRPADSSLASFFLSALKTHDVDSYGPLLEALLSRRELGAGEQVELAYTQLRSGSQDAVIARADTLMATGIHGQIFLAMAGLVSGQPWAQTLAEHLLSCSKPEGRVHRRLTELLSALRAAAGQLDLRRFASRIEAFPKNLQLDAFAVLLAGGYVAPDLALKIDVNPPLERELWMARLSQLDGRDVESGTIAALNAGFISKGMVPVGLTNGQGGFFHKLLAAPCSTSKRESTQPLVTVIIAAYNSAETFGYAIKSVLAQSYGNLEIIVIDDASEAPLDIAGYLHYGRQIKLIRLEKNVGPYTARNIAIRESIGEFITTHDADDWMHPQKIAKQVAELERTHCVAAYSKHVRIREDGRLVFENNGRFLGDGPVTSMFRRYVFDRLGGFPQVRTRGDVEFKARISSAYGASMILHQDELTILALDSDNSNSRRALKTWREEIALTRFKLRYLLEHPVRCLMPFQNVSAEKDREVARDSNNYVNSLMETNNVYEV